MNADYELARNEMLEAARTHTMVAAFGNRDCARTAEKQLQDEGFRNTWIGVTRADNFELEHAGDDGLATTLRVEDDSLASKIGRFFTGEGDSLRACLVKRGVDEAEARRIDREIEAGDVLLTVDGSNQPDLAIALIENALGDVLSVGHGVAQQDVRCSAVADDDEHIRLRQERLGSGFAPTLYEDYFVANEPDDDSADAPATAETARHSV